MKLTLSICFVIFVIYSGNGQTIRQGCLPGCSCGPQSNNKGTQYRVLTCSALPEQPLPSQFTTLQVTRCPANISRTDLLKLNPTSITTMDLSHSGIHKVADGTFAVAPQLVTLKLSFNSINTLALGHFLGCNKLQKIYLDSNELTNIEDGCFSRLPRLKILYLHHNKLKTLPPLPPNVIQLDISNNAISSLDNYAFQQNMKNVDLCDNPIKNIPQACFAKAQAMTSLCAPSIPVVWKSANVSQTATTTPTTILPSLLNFTLIAPTPGIELSNDIMKQITAMENLKFLTIVGYKITSPVFLGVQILQKLKLENVRLIGNKENEFLNAIYKQVSLQELELDSSPQLADILIKDVTVWDTLIKIHYLGLSNCSLTTLGHLQNKKGMVLVDLSSNPLHCDCSLATKFNNGVMIVGDLSSTLCNTPNKYQSQVLSKVLPQLCDEEEQEELVNKNGGSSKNPSNGPISSEETENEVERIGKIDKKEKIQDGKPEVIVGPGGTSVREVIPDDNGNNDESENQNQPIDEDSPNDHPVESDQNDPNGFSDDKTPVDGSNNPDGSGTGDGEFPSDNEEPFPTPDDQNIPNGDEEPTSENENTHEIPSSDHNNPNENENSHHNPDEMEETTVHKTEEIIEVTESQGFQGYLDENEHHSHHGPDDPKHNNEQTYMIVGIVIALTLIAAVVFATLFFYFRRRGHAGIEGGHAQYKSHATSRDNLVNKTRGYE